MSSALGVLELGLGEEYMRVIKGLEQMFPDALLPREWTYLRSHAIHDARHFRDVFRPLAAACQTKSDMRRVLLGVKKATQTKGDFVDGAYRLPVAT